MQQLAQAALEREAYAEEVWLYSAELHVRNMQQSASKYAAALQVRQAGAVTRLTQVLASTGGARIPTVQATTHTTSLCCSS